MMSTFYGVCSVFVIIRWFLIGLSCLRKIPKIRILTTQYKSLQGHRIKVRIDAWPVGSQYPQGHFVSVVGRTGDLETEIDTILTENDISVTPFSQVT